MPISRNIELEFRKSHAFVIGIDEYPFIDANLETSGRDAREVAKRLKVLQGFDHVLLMNNVGLKQLRKLLNWLKDPARPMKLSIANESFQTPDGDEYESRISWLSTEKGEDEDEQKSRRDLRLKFEGETTRLYEWKEMELDIRKEKEKKLDEDQVEEQGVEISKGDSIVFYYAGHGYPGEVNDGPAGFLAPTDAKNQRHNNESLLPMEEVYQALSAAGCKHTLLVLDCCFAGKFRFATLGRGDSLPFLVPIHERRYKRYKYSKAWQVLASAGPHQEANDSAEWAQIRKHSPFAKTFIDALEGKADAAVSTNRGKNPGDGIITATELFLYVWERVEGITQGVKPQHPSLFPMKQHEEGEFIFINPKIKKDRLEFGADPDKNPYKGLKSYEEEDADRFFGREGAIKKAHEILEKQHVLFISGSSGSGKSSLVKAGIFPLYSENQKFIVRPVDLIGNEAEFENRFGELINLLETDNSLILLIDQYEEIFGHPEEELLKKRVEKFFKLASENFTRIIFTLRSDFDWQLRKMSADEDSPFRGYWHKERVFRLPPMDLDNLREALTGPAWWAMYDFKDHAVASENDTGESLINEILEEVAYNPGALPLLSFTMQKFYEIGREKKQRLILEDYRNVIKGVEGSLSAAADDFYEGIIEEELSEEEKKIKEERVLAEAERPVLRKLMTRLVNIYDGAFTRRRVYYKDPDISVHASSLGPEELDFQEGNELMHSVIDKMEKAFLLVKDTDENGQPYIELAHNALATHWDQARQWFEDFGKSNIILQRQLWQAVLDYKKEVEIDEKKDDKAAYASRSVDEEDLNTEEFSKLWDNNSKLLQVIMQAAEGSQEILWKNKEKFLSKARETQADEEKASFDAFWKACEEKQQIPDINSLIQRGYSDIFLDYLLGESEHSLNIEEVDFVKESWNKRIEKIMDLKRQRDEALAAKSETEQLLHNIVLQNQAFKQNLQDLSLYRNMERGIKPRLHFLGIGIDEYHKVSSLSGPVNDVKNYADVFQRQEGKLYDKVNTHLLLNEEARKERILDAIENIRQDCDTEDVFMLVLSGHGYWLADHSDGYFIPHVPPGSEEESELEQLGNVFEITSKDFDVFLKGEEVCEELSKFDAKVLLILDFCGGAEFLQSLIKKNYTSSQNNTHNVFGLSATSTGQNAFEISDEKGRIRGLFSYALEKGFTTQEADWDGNGVLYLDELFQFSQDFIQQKKNHKQDIFFITPPTASNIPLIQFGEKFSLPKHEIVLGGKINEQSVAFSIYEKYPELKEFMIKHKFKLYDEVLDFIYSSEDKLEEHMWVAILCFIVSNKTDHLKFQKLLIRLLSRPEHKDYEKLKTISMLYDCIPHEPRRTKEDIRVYFELGYLLISETPEDIDAEVEKHFKYLMEKDMKAGLR